MKITIITACYNSVATIRDALESVAAQRVVDDWYLTDGERPEAIDIAAVRESALKSFAEVDDEDKRRIVCAIETTKVIPLRMLPSSAAVSFMVGSIYFVSMLTVCSPRAMALMPFCSRRSMSPQ